MRGPSAGNIAQGALPRLLRDLYVQRRTGLVQFSQGDEKCSVCFIRGHIAWGQSSLAESHLGPVLVRNFLLTQETLDRVFDLVGPGKRLGDVLLESGSLDRQTLDEALALQVRDTLLAVFSWSEGAWRFDEEDPEHFKSYDKPLGVPTGELILDACWSVTDPDVLRYGLGDLDRPLAVTSDPLLRYQRLTTTPMDGLLLANVDGVRSAREVLAFAGGEGEEAQRGLFGLLCTGIVEFVEAEPVARAASAVGALTREEVLDTHGRLADGTHFDVLGLARSASDAEIKAAWGRLARRYHPDSRHDAALRDVGRELDEIFIRMSEAARVLGDPQRRAAYEATLGRAPAPAPKSAPVPVAPAAPVDDPGGAEELLALAEKEFADGRYWDALQALERLGDTIEVRHRLRAGLLRGRAYLGVVGREREAERHLRDVVNLDPANVDALFLLGRIYKKAGQAVRASAMFRRVLALKPRHREARLELDAG